jgi:hypothetical protein
LRYFFFELHQTYDRRPFINILHAFCTAEDISSYGIYEVYGPVDIVFAAWIHRQRWPGVADKIVQWTNNDASQALIRSQYAFDADNIHYNWHTTELSDGLTDRRPTADAINELKRLPPTTLTSKFLLDTRNGDELANLVNKTLAFSLPPIQPEIRFIMLIYVAPYTIPQLVLNDIVGRIVKIVHSSDALHNAKVYSSGAIPRLLIDASVSFNDYHAILNIQSDINKADIHAYGGRTTTFLISNNTTGVEEVDQLRFRDIARELELTESSLSQMLGGTETGRLEFKGAVRLNLYQYLKSGRTEKDAGFETKVLLTIVAFLNSDGGDLVIGAIEPDRFKDVDLSAYPLEGMHHVVGIDADLAGRGFDKFQLYVVDLMKTRIGVATSSVQLYPIMLRGKLMCVLRVPKARHWQYLDKEQFAVRDGARTVVLKGADQEAYQRARS